MAGAVPGIGTVFGIIQKRLEERRLDAFQIALRLADDVLGHKFRSIFEHMDEAVQLAQDVVGQVAARFCFAVQKNWHVGVLPPHFLNKRPQVHHSRVEVGAGAEFFVVNRQHEGACAALLLGEF